MRIIHFSLPKEAGRREKWISNIANHQNLEENIKNFNICSLHFTHNDFKKAGSLKEHSFPTVFTQSVSHHYSPFFYDMIFIYSF